MPDDDAIDPHAPLFSLRDVELAIDALRVEMIAGAYMEPRTHAASLSAMRRRLKTELLTTLEHRRQAYLA